MAHLCQVHRNQVKPVSYRNDLAGAHGGEERAHPCHLDPWAKIGLCQRLGPQPRLAGDQAHSKLPGSIAQLVETRHACSPDAPVARGILKPRPVVEKRTAAAIRGEQHHPPAKRGGAGGEHERVMGAIVYPRK